MAAALDLTVDMGARAANNGGEPILLEEEIDENHVPTEEELLECAEWLGMDMDLDADYLWIARQFITAPMPKPWRAYRSREDNEVFYFNGESGESTWNHPCDEYHRQLFQAEKSRNAPVKVVTVSCTDTGDGSVSAVCTSLAGTCLAVVRCEAEQDFAGLRSVLAEELHLSVGSIRFVLPSAIAPDDEELVVMCSC